MNTRSRKIMMLAAVLTCGLFSLAQSALGQSNSQSNCKQAKGYWFDAANLTGGTTGTITQGGILNGTTETIYNSSAVFPDTDVVAYTADTTITTNQGNLRTHNVYIYNFVTGIWTAMGRINPGASTGRFAGATGVLYFNGTTAGASFDQYLATITGEICLANR